MDSRTRVLIGALFFMTTACPSSGKDAVRLGIDPALSEVGLGAWLKAVYEQKTDGRVRLVEIPANGLLAAVEKGELDEVVVVSPKTLQALQSQGLLADTVPVAHEEFLVVGPEKNLLGRHAHSKGSELLRNISRSNFKTLEPDPASLEGARHRELFQKSGDRLKPGSWFETQLSGVELVEASVKRNAYAIVRRSSMLIAARRGSVPARIWSERDPELTLVLHLGQVHPARAQGASEQAEAFHAWLKGPEGKVVWTTIGVNQVGHPFFASGPPSPGEGASFEPLETWLGKAVKAVKTGPSSSETQP